MAVENMFYEIKSISWALFCTQYMTYFKNTIIVKHQNYYHQSFQEVLCSLYNNSSTYNTSLDDDELSNVKLGMMNNLWRGVQKGFLSHHTLSNKFSFTSYMLFEVRGYFSLFSILFLYLLSGLHSRQLLTHAYQHCHFSLFQDWKTIILWGRTA